MGAAASRRVLKPRVVAVNVRRTPVADDFDQLTGPLDPLTCPTASPDVDHDGHPRAILWRPARGTALAWATPPPRRACGGALSTAHDRVSPAPAGPPPEPLSASGNHTIVRTASVPPSPRLRAPEEPSPFPLAAFRLSSNPLGVPSDAELWRRREARLRERMRLQALRAQFEGLVSMTAPLPSPADQRPPLPEKVQDLLAQVTHVKAQLYNLEGSIRQVEAELQRRGFALALVENGLCDVPDDDRLCQLCFTHVVDAEYSCCGYKGACATCVSQIQKTRDRCPHCRTSTPVVWYALLEEPQSP